MKWLMPPKVKVYEALGCIADNHVKFVKNTGKGVATVTSSEGFRKYNVIFDISLNQITSDDNGSKRRGYLGYPSIAVLMLKEVLPFNEEFSRALKGIRRYQLNKRFNNYDMTITEALRIAKEKVDTKKLEEFIDLVMKEIKEKGFDKLIKTQEELGSY
jgi:hypothetical protein